MNKKLAAVLSGGVVLVLTLSGCSDDSEEKLNAWAKDFCGQIQPHLEKNEAANAAIKQKTDENSKPAEVKKTDSEAFQQISASFKALAAALEAAGPPPVEDGETKQKDAVRELNASSKSYIELKAKVDALQTKDQAQFADDLRELVGEMATVGNSGAQALKKLQSGDVAVAMSKEKGCQKTKASTGAASPSGSKAPEADAEATPSASATEEKKA
ncbi:small secreted protein [Kitasatospora albolonga]|uniref:Small secreted protein n=1 Tax=Kitasatospora albolonga TaxID=68173 RepID=A0ABC8C3M5_9ACTN|nr:small secreted protein [Kitasatospora albolonga]